MRRLSGARLRQVVATVLICSVAAAHAEHCVPTGTWFRPGGPGHIAAEAVYAVAARADVVLLGESHAHAAHHRWQLETLTALHAARPDMVIGFEMFPRRVQPALDRWVAGGLSQEQFVHESDWKKVWRFDFELYRPLFEFARTRGIPMRALNVDQALVRETGANGFDAISPDRREGVSPPAQPAEPYVERLREVYAAHRPTGAKSARDDPKFKRFVDAQLLWDRAMAQALADARAARPDVLVVGIMGRGHVEYGQGVEHQLRDLGVVDVFSLLPWEGDEPCEAPQPDIADAVYGVEASPAQK